MAYCKIHAIRGTVGGAIRYITAPQKTDANTLVSAFECAPQTAAHEFAFMLSKTNMADPNKAYHLIHSFYPGEVDPATAHEIGKKLADELLGGNHAYVIATHIDKDHVHNHIVFCAAQLYENRKYHACNRTYRMIRNISDNICSEYGLSVIKEDSCKAKNYREWAEDKKGNSWKTKVRQDINSAIRKAMSYDDFIRLLKEQGYQIKGDDLHAESPKYISFLPPGKDRWVRSRASTLGTDYTCERISERIQEKDHRLIDKWTSEKDSELIVLSEETLADKPYLKKRADRKNLQTASEIYTHIKQAGYSSLEDALAHLSDARTRSKSAHCLTPEAIKVLIDLHARMFIIVERTTHHAVTVYI